MKMHRVWYWWRSEWHATSASLNSYWNPINYYLHATRNGIAQNKKHVGLVIGDLQYTRWTEYYESRVCLDRMGSLN